MFIVRGVRWWRQARDGVCGLADKHSKLRAVPSGGTGGQQGGGQGGSGGQGGPGNDPNYDPWAFYTATYDERGHGERRTIKMPPNVAAKLDAIVGSLDFPQYPSLNAFSRDAHYHRLEFLLANAGTSPEMKKQIKELLGIIAMQEIEATSEARANLIASAKQALERFAARKDRDGMAKYFAKMLATASTLPEPFRSQLQEVGVTMREWITKSNEEERERKRRTSMADVPPREPGPYSDGDSGSSPI